MTEHPTDENVSGRQIHLAPPELVFACLTTPTHLARFWGPRPMRTPMAGVAQARAGALSVAAGTLWT